MRKCSMQKASQWEKCKFLAGDLMAGGMNGWLRAG